jgi:hypothetical protein
LGTQITYSPWAWHSASLPQSAAPPSAQLAVQKCVVGLKSAVHRKPVPSQSLCELQYAPTPSSLPRSPGAPHAAAPASSPTATAEPASEAALAPSSVVVLLLHASAEAAARHPSMIVLKRSAENIVLESPLLGAT